MPLFRIPKQRPACGPCAVETHALNAAEAGLITAIAEQVLPPDEAPGTAEARAVVYIDHQLHGGVLSRLCPAYHRGLAAFEAAAQAETGSSFLDLPCDRRTAFLLRVQHGHKLTAFYQLLRSHIHQSLDWHSSAWDALALHLQQPLVQREHAV